MWTTPTNQLIAHFLTANVSATAGDEAAPPGYRGRMAMIVGMFCVFLLALWTGVYLHLRSERELVRIQSEISNINIATGIAEQTRTLSSSVDKMLLLFRLLLLDSNGPRSLGDISQLSWLNVDFLTQIAIADENGTIVDSNLGRPTGTVTIADRPHFLVQKYATSDELYISDPVIGRVSGAQTIQFTRGLRDNSGKFNGAIVASIDATRLSAFYRTIDLPYGGWVSLVNDRGVILAEALAAGSYPMVGESITDGPNARQWLSRGDRCVETIAIKTGEPILLCLKKVQGFPLWITLGRPLSAVYESYERDKFTIIGFAAGCSIVFLFISAAFLFRDRRLWDAQRQVYCANKREIVRASEVAAVLSSIDEGIFIIRPDGQIWGYNSKALELLEAPHTTGSLTPEMLAHSLGTRSSSDSSGVQDVIDALKPLMAPSTTIRIRGRTIELRTLPGHNGDLIKVLRDISEQVKARDNLRKNLSSIRELSEKRAEFLAILSHEIRTPLHAIIGYSTLLSETGLDERQQQLLDSMQAPAAHLRAIVNDVLDFLNLEAGGMVVKHEPFDLFALCDRISPIAATLIGSRGIEFRTTLSPDLPAALVGDEKRVFQLLLNFVGNAIKYTQRGFVRLDVSSVARTMTRATVRFVVTDTGQGIEAGDLEKLFKPFERGAAASGPREGVGLGLVICERIVKLMNGSINIASTPNVGTTASFEIPFELAEMARLAAPAPASAPPTSLRILVAEDNRASRVLMEKLLRRRGYEVVSVEDGRGAVEAAATTAFDLILMDLQMPVLDGLAATREIRRAGHGAGGGAFIIALTAQALRSDRHAAEKAGFDGFLEKPLAEEELNTILARATELRDNRARSTAADASPSSVGAG